LAPRSTLFPYTTLFRSFGGVLTTTLFRKVLASFTSVRLTNTCTSDTFKLFKTQDSPRTVTSTSPGVISRPRMSDGGRMTRTDRRSEEHTSELQSRRDLV